MRARWITAAACAAAVMTPAATAEAADHRCPRAGGDTTVDVRFGGTSYPVLVYVPESARRSAPLVLNLHGSSANGPVQMEVSGLREVADDEGFLVAAPSAAIPLAPQNPPDPNGAGRGTCPACPPPPVSCRRRPRATMSRS